MNFGVELLTSVNWLVVIHNCVICHSVIGKLDTNFIQYMFIFAAHCNECMTEELKKGD
jgi:hypothetical protein